MQEQLEEACERFCIMTENPDVDEITACKYIQEKYGREIAIEVWKKYDCMGKK